MRSDAETMRRVCDGDADAFAAVVERYRDALINYLTHLTRSRERAEEVGQEAFVRLYRRAAKYRDHDNLAPYLFRIATDFLVSEMRREKRWRLLLPRLIAVGAEQAPAADANAIADEVQRQVSAALAKIPLKFRAPLTLYEIEEWSYDDIATALGCRVGTVKSRIARARALMRRRLAPWWTGGTDERSRTERRAEAPSARDGVATLHL